MRAYSLDLRQKVVAAYERGESSIDEIAALFSVGPTFVKKCFACIVRVAISHLYLTAEAIPQNSLTSTFI